MLQDEDYDSDTSDEDFLPEGAESEDEPVSEDEEEEHDDNEEAKTSVKVKKKTSSKKKKKNPLLADLEETEQKFSTDAEDKGEIVKDGKDKEKADNLWADFLADVEDTATPPPKPKSSSWASLLGNKKTPNSSSPISGKAPATTAKKQEKKEEATTSNSTMVKITQVFDFAGEEVRVEKEVNANSDEAKLALSSPSSDTTQERTKGMKRPGGLSSIMGLLDGKKQKLTTLEKTKLDWNNFKSNEGIDEELESHKKSKHGYLDKQAFLERADVRQFEIERAMRMNKRSNR